LGGAGHIPIQVLVYKNRDIARASQHLSVAQLAIVGIKLAEIFRSLNNMLVRSKTSVRTRKSGDNHAGSKCYGNPGRRFEGL